MFESYLLKETCFFFSFAGIDFTKRLPCGEVERARRSIRTFFRLRQLSLTVQGREETKLPLSSPASCIQVQDVLDLSEYWKDFVYTVNICLLIYSMAFIKAPEYTNVNDMNRVLFKVFVGIVPTMCLYFCIFKCCLCECICTCCDSPSVCWSLFPLVQGTERCIQQTI